MRKRRAGASRWIELFIGICIALSSPAAAIHYPDYCPIWREAKTFRWTYGRSGEWTSRTAGLVTVHYGNGSSMTGTLITNGYDAPGGLWDCVGYNNGSVTTLLMIGQYYLSSDEHLTSHPPRWPVGTVFDGMLRNPCPFYLISRDGQEVMKVEKRPVLFDLQSVNVLHGRYENALVWWAIDGNCPYVPMDFVGKDVDLGLVLPTASATGGGAVTSFRIRAPQIGAIALGGVDPQSGRLLYLAELTKRECKLHVQVDPPDGGSVTCSPAKAVYSPGELVTLTATPAPGTDYVFAGWSGDLTGPNNPATLVMDADKSVTARFEAEGQYTLDISVSPENGGTVARDPNKAMYAPGDSVTLTGSPAGGYTFRDWSGDVTGPNNPATLEMDSNKSVTARFYCSDSTRNWYGPNNPPPLHIDADSGEWLEREPDGPLITLKYYRPGWEPEGRLIAKCWFFEGCNIWCFSAPDDDHNNVPDCFHHVSWENWDSGDDDCPPQDDANEPRSLDCIAYHYDVCSDHLRILHRFHDYPDGCLPPISSDPHAPCTLNSGCAPPFNEAKDKDPIVLHDGSSVEAGGFFGRDYWSVVCPGKSGTSLASGKTLFHNIGDLDWDGDCDKVDFDIARAAFGFARGQAGYDARVDIDLDGFVSEADCELILGSSWYTQAHWKFDEGSGTVAVDSAGGNDGEVHGAAWCDGILGGALRFDGVDDYVDCGVHVGEVMSLSLWVYPESLSGIRALACESGYSLYDNNLRFEIRSGRVRYCFADGVSEQVYMYGATDPNNYEWSHLAVTRDGTEAAVYLNGVKGASAPYDFAPRAGSSSLTVGGSCPDAEAFKGRIDDVRLYERALSEEEIRDLAQAAP